MISPGRNLSLQRLQSLLYQTLLCSQDRAPMALASLSSTVISHLFGPKSLSKLQCAATISFNFNLKPFPSCTRTALSGKRRSNISKKAQALDFSGSFYEGGLGSDDEPPSSAGADMTAVEEKEAPPCPPGLRQYETMAVLRPDMSEDERLTLTQKYEEILVAGGGMYVEVFNRGVIPLAYSIRKKNKAGESNTYLDGIYLLFTYFTKPESIATLEETLKTDDDVIRSSSFKIRKRKF